MALEDRDYYREADRSGGGGAAGAALQTVVARLILINGALFLANAFFGGQDNQITRALMLHSDAIVHPWMWYQFLTAGFVHDWENLLHIVGNMLGLFVLGRELEQKLGGREFLLFYLASIVFGSVVWSVRNHFFAGPDASGSCLGASGGVTAVIILFCLQNPRAMLGLVPIPAWVFGLLVVATDIFGSSPAALGSRVAYDVHLAGAAFALAYWAFGWSFGKLPGISQIARLLKSPRKWLEPKPPLRVHDPEQYYEKLDEQADRLLEKVNREGLESLNAQERQLLEDYSRRTRQKLR